MVDSLKNPQFHNKSGKVHDAAPGNLVDKYAPIWAAPYLRLSRIDRPIGTWLLLIPCWWGLLLSSLNSGPFTLYDAWIASGCALGAILMRGAGCTWNDIVDRNLDANIERTRTRPLPSKIITVWQAYLWLVFQALLAFLILLTFNMFTVILGISSLTIVAIYPFAKRFTWWPQIFLGLAFNWGVLLGWSAHMQSLSAAPILLYLSGIYWTLFYDTIYALQDKVDDALIGIRSTARLFCNRTKYWLGFFAVLSAILMASSFLFAVVEEISTLQIIFLGVAIISYFTHLIWQLSRLQQDDPDICLKLFRSNRDTGLLPVCFMALAVIFG